MKPHETPAAPPIARATSISAKSPPNGLQKIRRFLKPHTQLPNVARHRKPSVSTTVARTQRSYQAPKTAPGSLEKHQPASANPHLRHCPDVSPSHLRSAERLKSPLPLWSLRFHEVSVAWKPQAQSICFLQFPQTSNLLNAQSPQCSISSILNLPKWLRSSNGSPEMHLPRADSPISIPSMPPQMQISPTQAF